MPVDKKELSKLPLRERIKRLKELEEDRKKEIDEIDDLIKNTQKEIRNEKVADQVSPETEDVDISKLFGREDDELEKRAKEAETTETPKEESKVKYLTFDQALEDYEELAYLSSTSQSYDLNEKQMQALDNIGERLDRAKYTVASKEVANLVVASRSTLYKIRKYAGLEDRSNF